MAAIHSVEQVVFTVPDLTAAETFYAAFGLVVRRDVERLELFAPGHPHRWVSIHEHTGKKKLAYVSYAIFESDVSAFRQRIRGAGMDCEPHPMSDGGGLWLRDPDGVAMQLVVGPKVSPSRRPDSTQPSKPAPNRRQVVAVRPRHLSHALRFSPDVPRMVRFCTQVLGLRLSDQSGDVIAFLHSPHGSDHHLVGFAKSEAPGLHHTSWDVGCIDDLGCGAEQMKRHGYSRGWGVGRHVIGSNYFYYAQDPWGSFAEYSFDIDFIGAGDEWKPRDHPPEDSLYVWGPPPPEDFVRNYEA